MSWNQKNARFYCRVNSARTSPEIILSDARRGLYVVAAGEHGAIEVLLSAAGQREENVTVGPRGGRTSTRRNVDTFRVSFIPWRSCEESGASSIDLAWGILDFDRIKHGDTCIRLDDETMEFYRMVRAKELMSR